MIIWKGWGILGAIIPVIFIVLHNGFLGPDTIGWALLTSAVPVWLLGRNFHARPAEVMIDPKTKQNILVKPEHDLFWVELDETKSSKFAKKPAAKKQFNTSNEGRQLTEAERKKKAFYAQMRKDRETDKIFKASNHSNYFPGSSQPIPPVSEIEEEIFLKKSKNIC